ncbi:MAG TPA: DNA-directed RNA polymerase [Candidatus Nitrosocosmicus sp.]|jgi:DNA-directed RNA polymerase subunit E'|nr:DNA-directed RNA polymerase [Candidatus Nitrosocosmicus sp.]
MFAIAHMSDVVRIPPSKLTNSLKLTAIGILKEKYESMVSSDLGYVILIIDAETNAVGKVIAGDGATYHKVNFTALTFYPKLHEVVEGEVVEITDFGAFVRIGPTDALLHLSQITDDYLKSDVKQGLILSNQSEKTLRISSKIRARITAISLGKSASMGKIGITCRQPFLGALEWVEKEIRRAQGKASGENSNSEDSKADKKSADSSQARIAKKR